MNFQSILGWLYEEANRNILGFIGSGLVIVCGGVWTVYQHFSKKKQEETSTDASKASGISAGGNISAKVSGNGNAIIATGNVTFGITPEQLEAVVNAVLKRREQEILNKLAQASAADKEKIIQLDKELTDVLAKLQNPEAALEEFKQKLADADKTLANLKQQVLPKQIAQAQADLKKGETAEAEKVFTQVLAKGKENAAEAAYQLAQLAENRIDYATASRYFKEAADLQSSNALYLNKAGMIAYTIGCYSEAEPLLQRSLAIREKALGEDHPDVAESLNNLGELYYAQGKYAQVESLLQRGLAIREKALGKNHPDVATNLNNLAALYRAQGKYEQAELLYRRSLAVLEKALGEDHPDVANILNNLAELYRAQGKYEQAEPLYHRSLAVLEKALGEDHPDVATSLNNLALLYDAQGKYEQAEPLYRRSLAVLEKAFSESHPHVVTSLNNLAMLYDAQGKYEQAEPLYRRSLAVSEEAFGKDHPTIKAIKDNFQKSQAAQHPM